MFINNELRDEIFKSSILHGFWDNNRTYNEFIETELKYEREFAAK